MSVLDWYLLKAEQCELKANASVNPRTRIRFEEEQRLWREFAEREAASIFGTPFLNSDVTARRRLH